MRGGTTVLVTGFSPFPNAPENPSEVLIDLLRGAALPGCALRLDVLRTEYAHVRDALGAMRRARPPDIAVHFGLSIRARGFKLERLARNRLGRERPDAAGVVPSSDTIAPGGPPVRESTLPLAAISRALGARGLPVEASDDAGDYVCNCAFYLSAAGRGLSARPRMAGFVHVPLLEEQLTNAPFQTWDGRPLAVLTRDQLLEGALLIVRTCVEAWRAEIALGEAATGAPA